MSSRAMRGLLWQYGATFGGRILSLVAVALLARLLDPRDFGLVALALVFTGLLDVLKDFGLSQALVVSRHEDENAVANTVFRWGVGIGLGLWALVIAISPAVASFFGFHQLIAMISVLGGNFFLRSLGLTHYAISHKRLDFRTRTVAELTNTGVRGAAGVVMALAGLGAWALVLSYLVGTAAFVVALWVQVPWRPSWRGGTVPVRGLLVFGGTLTLVDLLAAVLYSTDGVVIGKMIGDEALGLYSLATRLPELIILNFSVALAAVLFPAFAGVPVEDLGNAFTVALRYTLLLALPLAVGLVVMAGPVVTTLFGEKWNGSVDTMRILCVYALFYAIGIPAGTVYKAIGRAGLLLILAIPQVILVVAFTIPMARIGIEAVASVIAAVTALFFLIGLIIVPRMIPVGFRDLWDAAKAPLGASAVTGAVLLVMERLIDLPLLEVVLAVVLGGAVYFGTMWVLSRETLLYLAGKLSPKFARA